MRGIRNIAVATVTASTFGTSVLAQDLPTTEGQAATQSFEPAFFARFSPQTASDMVRRVPGFSIQRFGGDGRGLGGGGMNVLINGAEVTGKGTDALTILSRMPASAVTAIEVSDASRLGLVGITGDVANVRITSGKPSFTVQVAPRFRRGLAPDLFNAELSVSGTKGRLDYTLGFENDSSRRGDKGPEIVIDDAGDIVERRDEDFQAYEESPEVTALLSYRFSDNIIGTLNASHRLQNRNTAEERRGITSDGIDIDRSFQSGADPQRTELSGDLTLPFFAGELRLIAVDTRQSRPEDQSSLETEDGAFSFLSERFSEREQVESIQRAEWIMPDILGGNLELSAEHAFNSLENEAFTETVYADGTVELSVDTPTKVEEQRYEAAAAFSQSLNDQWSYQLSVGLEHYEISQPGGTVGDCPILDLNLAECAPVAPRSATDPKGRLAVTYRATPKVTVRGQIERQLGQLDFGTFVSSVSLADERATAGNSEIVPDQAWQTELELEYRITQNDVLTFGLGYRDIENIVDRIPFDTDGDGEFDTDGPGNIATASRLDASVEAELTLDRWNIPGGELDVEVYGTVTETQDPLTGETRELSGRDIFRWVMRYRQRIPQTDWEYGISVRDNRRAANFSFDQYARMEEDPFASMFLKHHDILGGTGEIWLGNIFNREDSFDRVVFQGPRDLSGVDFIETRQRTFGQILRVEYQRTF